MTDSEARCGYVEAIDSIVRGTCCGDKIGGGAPFATRKVGLGATDESRVRVHVPYFWVDRRKEEYECSSRVMMQQCCASCFTSLAPKDFCSARHVEDIAGSLVQPFARFFFFAFIGINYAV